MAPLQAQRALVARVPYGRAAASGVRACAHSSGGGEVSGAARHGGGSRRSELAVVSQRTHARPRSSACARAERGGSAREREGGERKKSTRFDLVQTRDFQLKLEKF
jgi:hypothetical protein